MSSPQYGTDYVRALAPYQAGKPISEVAREFGLDESKIVKLASNENPLGMPASAKAAMIKAMDELARYPDANGFDLKAAIAKKYDVPAEWITLGNGSNDILELSARAFVKPGEGILFAEYSFAVYPIAAQAVGARAIVVKAQDFGHDLNAMAAAITADTKLVFVANPNNPTGTFVPGAELQAFLDKVPQNVVVVLDEAYTEFLKAEQRYDSIAWVKKYPNLLVSRTMSKAYGLAGLRVGFAIAQPALTELLNRVRQPFNVNSLAQAAAIAALNDLPFLQKSAEVNAAGYVQITTALRELRLPYVESSANFVLFKAGEDDGAGARVNLSLLKQGVIVRPVASYGLPAYLRVSIGTQEENAIFIAALKAALA